MVKLIVVLGLMLIIVGCDPVISSNEKAYYRVTTLNGYVLSDIPEDATIKTIQLACQFQFETDAQIVKEYFNNKEDFFMWNDLNFQRGDWSKLWK